MLEKYTWQVHSLTLPHLLTLLALCINQLSEQVSAEWGMYSWQERKKFLFL